MTAQEDRIALIDLDGTVANYDEAMVAQMASLQAPGEPPYVQRYAGSYEDPHMEHRRKLIQCAPGFWRSLRPIQRGFDVVKTLEDIGFTLHVLTKGPRASPGAWGEKVEWCLTHLPQAVVTVTGDKSLVYGRVLFDDYPPYFEAWLKKRTRGVVVCLAHPWNEDYASGGPKCKPNIIRYTDDMRTLRGVLERAYEREQGEAL
jgi:5'-nucleotidase